MTARFFRDEQGQSIVLIAGGFAVLLMVAALSLDFGYGYVERRTMTNAAQSAALGAGRLLATSLLWSSGSPCTSPSSTGKTPY